MGSQGEEEEVKGLESPTVTGRRGGRGRGVSVSKYHSIFNTTYVSTEINPDQDYSGNFIKDIVDNIVSTSVLSSLRKRVINLAVCNSRGVVSKLTSIQNMLVDGDLDVLGITETLLQHEKRPRVPGYFPMFRNRVGRTGGGVALLIKDKYKGMVVKEEQGEEDCEFVSVTFTCFEPRVSVVVYYGQQENTVPRETICRHLAAVLASAEKLHLDGNLVFLVGDFNVHVGNRVCENTNTSVSPGGQALLSMLEETDMEVINNLNQSGGSGHTHYDRTAGSSNILDLVLTNDSSLVTWLEVDEKFQRTPYRWKWSTAAPHCRQKVKMFSDHCAIHWQAAVQVKSDEGNVKAPKVTRWRYGKPGGHEVYHDHLESKFADLLAVVTANPDINEAVRIVLEEVDAAKAVGYGKTTNTATKTKRLEEEKEWKRKMMEIEEFVTNIEEKYSKPMTRIWSARKGILLEGRYAEDSAVKNHWTGQMLRERDEIADFSLEFNRKVLEKTEPLGQWSDVRNQKVEQTKWAMLLENAESKKPISNREFQRALWEVAEKNKDVYQDLNRSGPKFKQVIMQLIQRIYMTGEIPEVFKETVLMKLHKKGAKNVMDNYRWLHLKNWLPKLTEKVVLLKLKQRICEATPEAQLGGQPLGSCAEHLVAVNTVLNMRLAAGKATVIHLYDVRKCFDQVNLWDVGWEAAQAGIVGRDLRFLMGINQDIRMRVCGDDRPDSFFTARDTVGQGMVSACLGSALTISRVVDRHFQSKADKITIGDVQVEPCEFVDDILSLDEDAAAGKDSCARVSASLDELALRAHPTKSVRIVVGPRKKREEVERINDASPEIIQEFEVKSTQSDMYLGMLISQEGPRASCTANIELKRAKVAVRTQLISRILKEEKIKRLGWMRAAVGLIQGIVLQVLTYGTESNIQMTKTQERAMEKIYKDSVYSIMELSKYANYSAVMFELGLMPVEDVIKLKKINFTNKLMHVKAAGMCYQLLRQQRKETPEKGLLAEVAAACDLYELPDVGENFVEKNVIDSSVKQAVATRLWLETFDSTKTFKHWTPEMTMNRSYFMMPKLESKLLLALRIGELNFKLSRKRESLQRYGGLECFVGVCLGLDGPQHVSECFGYEARLKPGHSEKELAEYLKELHLERMKKYSLPLVYMKP